MSILAVERLSLSLGGRPVLAEVSHAFAPGRVTALLGPNGAGKSTLLACLAALRSPDMGSVTLGGVPLARIERRERARRIGLLPQDATVHWNVDARTLVGLGRLPHRGRWGLADADRAAIDRAIAATDIGALIGRPVDELSGGERGRVLLARVLAGEPEWLLADEPLASLDPRHQLDMLDRLAAVARAGRGVVVVLHDLSLAARVADEVVLIDGGRVTAAGAADRILTAEAIGRTYGIAVEIGRTAGGERYILPVRQGQAVRA